MMINGVTQLVMMKVDVLNIFEEIHICTAYQLPDGTISEQLPYDMTDTTVTPVYETLKGWNCSLEGLRKFEDLPAELSAYIAFLEEKLALPINFISTGPDRDECVLRGKLA
jgi:adenylosuccinate synthase